MSALLADAKLLETARAHVAKAFEAIAEILADKTAAAATRLRAALSIIELAYGKPGRPGRDPSAQAASVLAPSVLSNADLPPPRKESMDERLRRMRREKAAQAATRPT